MEEGGEVVVVEIDGGEDGGDGEMRDDVMVFWWEFRIKGFCGCEERERVRRSNSEPVVKRTNKVSWL